MEFSVNPHRKTICGHNGEVRTWELLINYINRDIPHNTELCMVDIKLIVHKLQMFKWGVFQVWSKEHFIKIGRKCLLKLQLHGPTLSLLYPKLGGSVGGIYILNNFSCVWWYSCKFENHCCEFATSSSYYFESFNVLFLCQFALQLSFKYLCLFPVDQKGNNLLSPVMLFTAWYGRDWDNFLRVP